MKTHAYKMTPRLRALVPAAALLAGGVLAGCDSDGRSVAAESVWSGASPGVGAESDDQAPLAVQIGEVREHLGEVRIRLDELTALARLPEHSDAQELRTTLHGVRASLVELEARVNEIANMQDEDAARQKLDEDLREKVEDLDQMLEQVADEL